MDHTDTTYNKHYVLSLFNLSEYSINYGWPCCISFLMSGLFVSVTLALVAFFNISLHELERENNVTISYRQ